MTVRLSDMTFLPLCDAHLALFDGHNKPVIYFIEGADRVKIGYAKDWPRRFRQLQAASPVSLRVIHLMHGDLQTEAELHRRFADLRHHGEWFDIDDELASFVKGEVSREPEAINA